MRNFDLHSHSTVSDGLLEPAAVAAFAARNGVEVYALTDHDALAGLEAARAAAEAAGMEFIDGVEISVTWETSTLHIIGLRIDPRDARLAAGLEGIRSGRRNRAARMAEDLAAHGIAGSLEGAYCFVANPEMIGRTHFARFLVESGVVPDVKTAFRHYLVRGKPGFVPHTWASLADAVTWIREAGGVAVIAHPGRYAIGAGAMRRLLAEFKELGGAAVEVVTSNHSPDQTRHFAALAREFGLAASRGSDFHGPGESYVLPGRLVPLPAGLTPVWEVWR